MSDAILAVHPLPAAGPWPAADPFLFCVHHLDRYPRGNAAMGPAASLAGRDLGMDFGGKDGWSMYHGDVVPGFPQHPHRGFETVTIARAGLIDHSDSLGARARFGRGDVQWMTAGRGVVHSEMFPLVNVDADNPTELFQIWLNLARADKMVAPYFTMLWREDIPVVDDAGVAVTVVAGAVGATKPPPPPPNSYAAKAHADVAIQSWAMPAGSRRRLAATGPDTIRALYVFGGAARVVDVDAVRAVVFVAGDVDVDVVAGDAGAEVLLLQGRPIGEPVAQHGPFVMNSAQEIRQAFLDYEKTRFGGWPWPSDAPVHARDAARFAKHADGREEHR